MVCFINVYLKVTSTITNSNDRHFLLQMQSAAEQVSSITPNKRKRNTTTNAVTNKENNFTYNGFMETKSIGELLTPATDNPFEVIRKPPKKKKKRDSARICCFDNEALNVNGPEKSLNPFEIRRASTIGIPIVNGFVNSGLNIRGPENDVCNPFEIVRDDSANVPSISTPTTGKCSVLCSISLHSV